MGNYPTKLYSNKINWMMMRVPKVVVRLIWLIYESVPEHCSNIEFVEMYRSSIHVSVPKVRPYKPFRRNTSPD
ncbi:MAG: hypothetical protein CVV29_05590 [Methanobacteriales archaeon HGW-Methanobacteriales-2]|nr:MAG: hypothetical protein CVV29_05590 [Methanobacteriales archaeon HGW-Methanobacteriales-2]